MQRSLSQEYSSFTVLGCEMERITVLRWFVSHTVSTGGTNRYKNMKSLTNREDSYKHFFVK